MKRIQSGLWLAVFLAAFPPVRAADDDINELIRKCSDPDPAIRLQAITDVGKLDEKSIDAKAPDIVAALLGQFRDKDDKVREADGAALNLLAARGGSVFEALVAALGEIQLSPSANLFLTGFDKIPLKELSFLLKSLGGEHWAVRMASARALGRLRAEPEAALDTKQIVPALINGLKDDNHQVRLTAAETLQTFSKEAVPALLQALNEGAPELRAGAAFGLGFLHAACPPPETVAALCALLKDAKSDTRAAVITALGEFGIEARAALPDLESALHDDSAELRIVAALSMEKISSALHDATLPVLFQALANGAPAHRLEIMVALDRWNLELAGPLAKDAAPALIAVLDDAVLEVRRRAIQDLVKVSRANKDALGVLADALKHAQPLVRNGAMAAFTQLGADAKDAAPKIAEIMQHDDLFIREAAALVLLRVAPKAPEAALATRLTDEATAYRACKLYASAQTRYQQRVEGGGEYAQSLRGNHSLSETKSGAADLKFIPKSIADAEGDPGKGAVVYAAYRFKVLKAQGANAPGGAKSYLEKGRMTLGHALAAYPAKYDAGGRLTFLVSHEGTVYFKDLGADTAAIVSKLVEYDPDESWKSIKETEVDIDQGKF